jgi:pseudouridine synthase
MERLNRWLARAGVASRRAADRLIEERRVRVNGSVVVELGTKIDPGRDAVRVDGKRVAGPPERPTYLALHKPRAVVTTMSDPEGRPTVKDLIPGARGGLFPVGRLDYQSEGLLLVTDDGDLARDLMHPRSHLPKTYQVKVRGTPQSEVLRRLSRGVPVGDARPSGPAQVRMLRPGHNAWLEITVTEGRKHLVRRMLSAVGHPVLKLKRTRIGGVELGKLPPGESRALTQAEITGLRRAVRRGGASADRPARRN